MRIVQPTHLSPLPSTSPTLVFRAERGERFLVDVLEEDLVRVRHYPEGAPRLDRTWMVVGPDGDVPVEGRSRDDMAHFSRPDFGLETAGSSVDVRTQKLHLAISLDDFRIRWHDDRERCFAADLAGRAYSYDRSSRAVYHYMEHRLEDHYYGFGERCSPLDKAGMRFRMVNLDALSYDAKTTDPLYKHFPFYITLVPELGLAYGLLYDNLSSAEFDMGREIDAYHGRYRTYVGQDGDIDYYLIFGPSIEAVVEKYTALTGRPMLPPRWSFGYLASTMAYTEAPNAQEQLGRFVLVYVEHQDGHLGVGRQFRAEMPVDQLQRSVVKLTGNQRAGIADLGQDAADRVLLRAGMGPPVSRVGPQAGGRNAAQGLDAVADLHSGQFQGQGNEKTLQSSIAMSSPATWRGADWPLKK